MSSEEPRLFVDEDWKARVRREREEARKRREVEAAQSAPSPAVETPSGESTAQPAASEEPAPPQEAVDPASFEGLVLRLATEAGVALGLFVQPNQKQVYVDPETAYICIRQLEMLQEKTKGNLTPQEKARLETVLPELQRLYLMLMQRLQEAAMKRAGINLDELKANP